MSIHLKFTPFADDTTVTACGVEVDTLTTRTNEELYLNNQYSIQNRSTINTDETGFSLFSSRTKTMNDTDLRIGDGSLKYTASYKFLGVTVDKKLKFNTHVSCIISKVAKYNGILYRNEKCLTTEARVRYNCFFVYLHHSYNTAVWGKTHRQTFEPLVIAQKRVIRCFSDAEYRAHTSLLFKQLQILKLEDIKGYSLCIHMFNSLRIGLYKKKLIL